MRLILVTGGNKGIGLAIVTKLLQDYPDTYLLLGSRDVRRGQAALTQLLRTLGVAAKNRVDMIELDVTDDESVNKAVEVVKKMFGNREPLYGLVNNAGAATGSPRDILELNTFSVRRVTEAFLPLIKKDKGIIIGNNNLVNVYHNCRPSCSNFIWSSSIFCEKLQLSNSEGFC